MEAPLSCKQKVLIVDDTPSNLLILGEEFKEDYQIYIAKSGEEALKRVEAIEPDLILLDILMPGLDGYQVCETLKEKEETRKIPIIFITAKNTEEDEVRGLDLGAVDYITKPFRLPIVKARVRTHLELKRKTDILESISSRDGLTGLFNRREWDSVIEKEWLRALRGNHSLSVILLDIDFFKLYNDHYGHLAGDQCLKDVARALSFHLKRASDFLARYGGEEFVILLPETLLEEGVVVANKVRKTIEDLHIEHRYSKVTPFITISAGVAATVPRDTNYTLLLDEADSALYEAKELGRNRVQGRELSP